MVEWCLVIDKALSHVCTFNLRQTENQGECGLPRITVKISGGIQGDPEPGPAARAAFKPQTQLLPPSPWPVCSLLSSFLALQVGTCTFLPFTETPPGALVRTLRKYNNRSLNSILRGVIKSPTLRACRWGERWTYRETISLRCICELQREVRLHLIREWSARGVVLTAVAVTEYFINRVFNKCGFIVFASVRSRF